MSWDAVILRIRGPLRPAAKVPESDYRPLGSLKSVAAAIRSAFPSVVWEEKTRAHASLDEYTAIEFDFHKRNGYSFLLVSVRGSRDPVPPLLELATANDWVVLDVQNSEFIDPAKPSRAGWRGYRSLVDDIGRGKSGEE
ncbi:MAG: hypothetical protein J2P46_07130 [Zavarzinella sp.]|nr:hypothetical protein [Zavarzinella sp.]